MFVVSQTLQCLNLFSKSVVAGHVGDRVDTNIGFAALFQVLLVQGGIASVLYKMKNTVSNI